ncbi:MAG: gamma-butyrobetaine hydroxylase [Pelagibacteraceae bacterium]|nr:gamma-butyrobetaine hydroxylase [Pelagibacteraceae bacterium]|tara:strand:- start:42842 stop:43981 length:1140 start_codon:yes stop_codon:yes gene_type:complete
MIDKYNILNLSLEKEYINIIWQDNHESKFHFLWLRDNCPTSFHLDSKMRKFNILSVSKDIYPKKINNTKNKLIIHWNEHNHISHYELRWLRNHCYTEINNQKYQSPYLLWKNDLNQKLKLIILNHDDIISNNNELIKWLELLNIYGIAIIKNAPTSSKSAFEILNKISHHRETFFGTPFEVINIPKPNNQAYTADALTNHSDLPYFEYAPGYQFLHCLENTANGGDSTAVDGFAVANYLKNNEKEVFNILTSTQIKFKDNDFTQKAIRILYSPIITLTKDNDFNDIRLNMGAMATIDVHPDKMKKFYEAYRLFTSLLNDKKFMIEFKLEKGDIFCFNNRRVLHGRSAFDPNSGNRHLQGYYIERDEIISKLNYFKNVQI